MIDKRSEILVIMGSFPEAGPPVDMPGHHGHVLKMALAAFVADRTVMGMVEHQPLDDAFAEMDHLRIVDGDAHAVFDLCHAGHDDLAFRVLIVAELLYRALPARADGSRAGCQQKYGTSKPRSRQASRRFLPSLTS